METIILNGTTITYDIIYKDIKHLYLRFKDGKIIVIASKKHSKKDIEALFSMYQDKVFAYIEEYEPPYEFKDNGYVKLFDHKYPIVLDDHDFEAYRFSDGKLVVYQSDIEAIGHIMMERTLRRYISKRMDEYLKYSFILPKPKIVIKKAKRRWGACFHTKNKVTFNLALVHLDKELIDYVIVHELCHFIQPNHSREFYREVEKRMPDYKERRKKLRNVKI